MNVLHIIDQLGAGGPARSLLGLINHCGNCAPKTRHIVASLAAEAYPPLVFAVRALGCQVLRAASDKELFQQIADADVVLVHFWNTPRMWRLLAHAPPARYVIWSKILGTTHPQILANQCLSGAAHVILTSPWPGSSLPGIDPACVSVVAGIADFDRLRTVRPVSHNGFNVDFIGTLNAGKIHPAFATMMSRIDIPGIAVRLYGGQPDDLLMSSIRNSADPSRFQLHGFVEDIASVLSTSDVFGYPLSAHTYATSDKSLQEAMYAGVPAVVLSYGGPARFVAHGETGLVVETVEEFPSAVEWLFHNPVARRRMGQNAQRSARSQFRPELQSQQIVDALDAAASSACPAGFGVPPGLEPGALFLVSQGWQADLADRHMQQWLKGNCDALDRWMETMPDEIYHVEGGVFHWRAHHPDHPFFRWWCARKLLQQGRSKEAEVLVGEAVGNRLPPGKWQEFDRLSEKGRQTAGQVEGS